MAVTVHGSLSFRFKGGAATMTFDNVSVSEAVDLLEMLKQALKSTKENEKQTTEENTQLL